MMIFFSLLALICSDALRLANPKTTFVNDPGMKYARSSTDSASMIPKLIDAKCTDKQMVESMGPVLKSFKNFWTSQGFITYPWVLTALNALRFGGVLTNQDGSVQLFDRDLDFIVWSSDIAKMKKLLEDSDRVVDTRLARSIMVATTWPRWSMIHSLQEYLFNEHGLKSEAGAPLNRDGVWSVPLWIFIRTSAITTHMSPSQFFSFQNHTDQFQIDIMIPKETIPGMYEDEMEAYEVSEKKVSVLGVDFPLVKSPDMILESVKKLTEDEKRKLQHTHCQMEERRLTTLCDLRQVTKYHTDCLHFPLWKTEINATDMYMDERTANVEVRHWKIVEMNKLVHTCSKILDDEGYANIGSSGSLCAP